MNIRRFGLVLAVPLFATACGGTPSDLAGDQSAPTSGALLSSAFYYLRCNATSWGVDEGSRLAGTASQLSLTVHVTQTYMVQGGDTCQLTQTNQLDGWGTSASQYALTGTSRLVVPATAPVAVGTSPFTVVYPHTGDFTATLDVAANTLTIGSPVSTTPAWVNLDSSVVNDNGVTHPLGGRVDFIRVDPRDANVVYAGTYGGGVWKSTDFTSAQAHWQPMTEGVVSLAVGGMDLDPAAPDTLYVGLGDPWDVYVGAIIKTTNGGAQWSAPVFLSGTYPAAAGGTFVTARRIRDVAVDPSNHNVLVATDVGLFVSTDGGATFQLRDLPNVAFQAVDNVSSIASVGASAGSSTWVVAGESADQGDLWRSSDGGATWHSGRAASAFPISPDGIHGMAVAAGRGTNPIATPVFVEADAGAGHTWLFRSTDGGQHYTRISGPVAQVAGGDCPNTDNILGGQGWFNRALAVDPSDSNHVIFGGQGCSVRTVNGLAAAPAFEQASWWIGTPSSSWPFVHADSHGALITNIGGVVRTYLGGDGGLFSSTNLWTTPAGSEGQIRWRDDNAGMNAQLIDWIGSGDPSRGLDGLVVAGLADQGSLMGVRSGTTWSFSTIGGGDGQEAALNGASGSGTIFVWDNDDRFCSGSVALCSSGSNYIDDHPDLGMGEGNHAPLFVPLLTDSTGRTFLAASATRLWSVTSPLPGGTVATWSAIGTTVGHQINGIAASPTTSGLYGAAASDGVAAVVYNGVQTVSTPVPTRGALRSISFPGQTPAGQTPGDTYVVADDGQDGGPAGHMYITTNRGQSWTALGTQGLPAVAVGVLRFDPSDTTNRRLYLGTFAGVYVSADGGSTWTRAGTGLPNVWVHDLVVSSDGSLVRIGTRGRGIWELVTR
jgi:hypothetical protein